MMLSSRHLFAHRQSQSAKRRGRIRARPRSYYPSIEPLEARVVLDSVQGRFVAQLYRDLLQREATAAEIGPWARLLEQGSSRGQVARLIENSPEYQTAVVQGLYRTVLHRPADPAGLSSYAAFLGQNGRAEEVEAALAGSPEYLQRHGGGSNDGFLAALYQDVLGRNIDPSGKTSFGQALAQHTSRTQVATVLVGSAESHLRLVRSYYRRFLDRAPDGGGIPAFVTVLQRDAGAEDAIAIMVGSDEYLARMVSGKHGPGPGLTSALTLLVTAPIEGAQHSGTARLIGSVGPVDSVQSVSFAVDGGAFTPLTLDVNGHFDQALASPPLAVGPHFVDVQAIDTNNEVTEQIVSFLVSADFLVGPVGSQGWGVTTADTTRLEERNSSVVQTFSTVALGQAQGTRTLRFEVNAQFDTTDRTSASGDRFLVYLVDPADPTRTLLDSGQPGTALLALGKGSPAEFPPGLVRYDGSVVQIDVTGVTGVTQGNLVFQLLNHDTDDGSVVQVRNLTDTVDPAGVVGPAFPIQTVAAVPFGPALDLAQLSPTSSVAVLAANVRRDAANGSYLAEVRLRNNGAPLGRVVAVVFPNLPAGVQLLNPSGFDASGAPYINFTPAIPGGGLGAGAISDPVQVVFTDPSFLRFALQPQVLVGAPNRPPAFNSVGPLTVMPGHRLEVPLVATDPDGDLVTFSLRSDRPMPTSLLQASGTLLITPAPAEVGTYNFTLVASDGALETTQAVTLNVVADPDTTTRVAGKILDGAGQPLAGVPIAAGSSTVTAADGSFTVQVTGGTTLTVQGDDFPGPAVYPRAVFSLPALLGHPLYASVRNDLGRPIFLQATDVANGQPIDPNQDTTVTTPAIPGEALLIRAGTLSGLENAKLCLTAVPPAAVPGLPSNLHPSPIVTVEPSQKKTLSFSRPAPLTLPNRDGWAPGTALDLWSLTPALGQFSIIGAGQVSGDGSVVQTTSGGVNAASWYFFAPAAVAAADPQANARNEKLGVQARRATAPFDSGEVELHSGAVLQTHKLVTYQSLGVTRGLTLHYDSRWADPRPIIHFGYDNVPAGVSYLVAQVTAQRGTFQYRIPGFQNAPGFGGLNGDEHFFSVRPGHPADAALQLDLRSLPTGVYDVAVTTELARFDGQTFAGSSTTQTIQVVNINDLHSPFGSGWGLAGWQMLAVNPDNSVLLIVCDGTQLLFRPAPGGGPYISPPGDFSTFERLGDGTFRRTLKDQTVYTFNTQNMLATIRDRNGNTTQYVYDGSGRLNKIVDPVGLQTVFGYTGDQVTSITDPAARVTQLAYDGAGNLMRITDPDTFSRSFEYDRDHNLTAEIDKRGNRGEDFYDRFGRATRAVRKDGTVTQVSSAQVQGLYPPAVTTNPLSPPPANEALDLLSFSAEANGVVTRTSVDQAGQILTQDDAVGRQLSALYDDQNLPVLLRNFLNRQSSIYDARGNAAGLADRLSGPFSLPLRYPVAAPGPVAVGDFNGDGIPDIVTVTTNSVVVLWGRGDGTFPTRTEIPGGGSLMVVGDFRGIGRLDIATVSLGFFNFLSVLLNNGNGTFTRNSLLLDHAPLSLAVGDLRGTGKLDLVTANTDSSVSVLLNNGQGSFTQTNIGLGHSPASVGDADLRGIGKLDLVTTSGDGTISVLLGNGDGTFATPRDIRVGGQLGAMALGDLNGDGKPDLVALDPAANQAVVLLGDGAGGFGAPARFAVGQLPSSVVIADLFGRGSRDIITANGNYAVRASVSVLLGNGDGTFAPKIDIPIASALLPTIAISDLKRDGSLDLVLNTLLNPGSAVQVLLNNATGPGSGAGTGLHALRYDPRFNQLLSQIDQLGHLTLYDLDPANGNRRATTVRVDNVDQVTRFTYTAQGLVKTETDPLGRVTENEYDALGRLTSTTFAKGTPDEGVRRFEYDPATGNQTAVIDEDGNRTEYEYTAMNATRVTRDALRHETISTYDPAGNLRTSTDARGNTTTYEYDPLNRLTRTTGPSPDGTTPGPVTTRRYDTVGNLVVLTDPLGHETHYAYDAGDRVIDILDPQGGHTRYTYDPDSNRTSITDPAGNQTTFAYNPRGGVTRETDPFGKSIIYDYDEAGNLKVKLDRDGRRTRYDYDELNRLKTESWVRPDNTNDNVLQFRYDAANNRLRTADNFSTLAFTYDNRNRTKTTDNSGTPSAPHVVLTYGYDPAGNLLSLADSIDGQPDLINNYLYDTVNRVYQVTQSGTDVMPKRVNFAYNEVGRLSTIDRFADLAGTQLVIHSRYDYDGLDRLTRLTHNNGSTDVAFYSYRYDDAGRIMRLVDIDGTNDFVYDNTDQLIRAIRTDPRNPNRSYTWDANGNPTGNGHVVGPGNRLLSDGMFNYDYDDEGNLIRRTEIASGNVREFQWDYRNRLIAIIDRDAGGTETQRVDFTYDAFQDRRISKRVRHAAIDDVLTNFVYDQDNVLLDFVANGGNPPQLAMRYLHGPAIDQVLAQENVLEPDSTKKVLWLLPDHLGSIRDLVDNSGTERNHIIYDAFGKVVFQSDPSMKTRYLYTGREFDEETGLYYYRARYYDPATGRFLSEDPLRVAAGDPNPYRYAKNNPVSQKDPTGKRTYRVYYPGDYVPAEDDVPLGAKTFVKDKARFLYHWIVLNSVYLEHTPLKGIRSESKSNDNDSDDIPISTIVGPDRKVPFDPRDFQAPCFKPSCIDGHLVYIGLSAPTPRAGLAIEWCFFAGLVILMGGHLREQRRRRRRQAQTPPGEDSDRTGEDWEPTP